MERRAVVARLHAMYELAAMLTWCADMNEWQRCVRGRGLQASIWYTKAEDVQLLLSFVLQRRGRGEAAAVLATGADIDIDRGGVLVNNDDL